MSGRGVSRGSYAGVGGGAGIGRRSRGRTGHAGICGGYDGRVNGEVGIPGAAGSNGRIDGATGGRPGGIVGSPWYTAASGQRNHGQAG